MTSALDRLTPRLRAELAGLAASFAMEGQNLSGNQLELGARYLLGEMTSEELRIALAAQR